MKKFLIAVTVILSLATIMYSALSIHYKAYNPLKWWGSSQMIEPNEDETPTEPNEAETPTTGDEQNTNEENCTEHIWDDGTVTTEATCTTDGVKIYTCTVCGDSYTETIAATGHTAVTDEAVAATCTTSGLTEGSHCSVCGEVISAQETVAATGHSWDDGTVTTEATCTTDGVKTYTCTVCGEMKTETIAATGHSYNYYGTCTVCGSKLSSGGELL